METSQTIPAEPDDAFKDELVIQAHARQVLQSLNVPEPDAHASNGPS